MHGWLNKSVGAKINGRLFQIKTQIALQNVFVKMNFDENQAFETRDPEPTRARTRELEEAGPSIALASSTTVTEPKRINASALDGFPIAAPTGVAEEAKKAEAVEANAEKAQKKEADRKAKKAAYQRKWRAKEKAALDADDEDVRKAAIAKKVEKAVKRNNEKAELEGKAEAGDPDAQEELRAKKAKQADYSKKYRANVKKKAEDAKAAVAEEAEKKFAANDREKVIALLNSATLALNTITNFFTTHTKVEIPIQISKAFKDATYAARQQIEWNNIRTYRPPAPPFQAVAVRENEQQPEIEQQPEMAIPLLHGTTFILMDIANAFEAMTYDFPQEKASAFIEASIEAEHSVRLNDYMIRRCGGGVVV